MAPVGNGEHRAIGALRQRGKSQGPLRLLLIEDVPADAELIQYELKKGGVEFSSRCIFTKRDFLKELRQDSPDAIISDFSMPQFNALDALQLLKAHRVEVPFILVTGSQSEEVAVECIKEGADDYILKSSLKRLPSALLAAITRKQAEKEREKAESALRSSEEHFRTLIDSSSDIITIVTPEGVVRYESPSVERALGYAPQELLGKKLFEFVHEYDRPRVLEVFMQELERKNRGLMVEHRLRHKDGATRYFESIFKNLVRNSAVGGVLVTSRDISERKRAEEQIREQAALLNKAQDAIIVMDLDERITFWNRSAERLYGWTVEEMSGEMGRGIYCDHQALSRAKAETLQRGDWHGDVAQVTKNGREILVESRWSLVRDHDNRPKSILIINSDITERKKMEAHFLRAQRMESIGTLAGGIAHDLNNVLTPILMSIKLLRDHPGMSGAEGILETLETSAHRGASIVQQVLSFARGAEGERTILQVKHPLNEVIKIAKDIFPPTVQVKSKINKDLWPVHGDATQIHQVLMNLFVNARDAMPHGGRIQVEAENSVVDENYARMQPDSRAGAYVVISVADTGGGIPQGLMPKIFEPFFTTKELGKGTGLGLSTALGIVKGHGGFLTVYSELGKGSCFKVHLPAAEECLEPDKFGEHQELPIGNGELILVVDDESAIREIIKVTLENNGYRVLTACDGTEAIAIYATEKDKISASLVDVMMPYMDGPSTVRAIQKLKSTARFIAISGLMENDKVSEISDLGNISFLAKPFTTEQLLNLLHEVLPQCPKP